MTTPATVRAAFAPELPAELTLDGVLLLEAIGCRYLTGGTPGFRDAILCHLAITDLPALAAARRNGRVDELVAAWCAGRRPADLIALQPAIAAAVRAAFEPAADDGAEPADAADPLAALEKKTPAAAAAGGSA